MDFQLTDEQRLIQDTVRSFVDERVLPVAVENDIAHRLDMGAIEGMAELGLLGIVIPEEYGGGGPRLVSEARNLRGDRARRGAFRTLISAVTSGSTRSRAAYGGREEQKQRYLVPQRAARSSPVSA